ncbi:uncharacterized protein LOC120643451 isoform X2 [Panicum virgatum]|uniref:uncharacterized protein LOC120643451 isoform X2 n=1 Tax=Panicum virgatum TaxID=38727 RepID=UPI0019D4F867|nr:uncharacterized protein LOC120643451 isoform X2 [Panicum virgatum]
MLILCRRKSSAPLQPPPEKVLQQYLEEQLIALLIKGPVAKRLAVGDPDAEKSGRGEGLGTGCGAPDAYTVHGLRCYGPRRIRHLLPAVGPPPSRRHGPLAPIPSKPAELLPFLSNKSTPIYSWLTTRRKCNGRTRRPRGTSCTTTLTIFCLFVVIIVLP